MRTSLCIVQLLKFLILLLLYVLDILLTLIVFVLSIIIYAPYIYIKENINPSNNKSCEKSIIIIGYSFAGLEIHKNLQNHPSLSNYKFTIIEPKTYFEFTPSITEAITSPSRYKSISFPFYKCFDSTRSVLIHGQVISIDTESNNVTVKEISSGSAYLSTYIPHKTTRSIHFDYCFVCTGSVYASPMKINTHPNIPNNIYHNQRAAEFEEIYAKLADNNSTKTIGIIGGGPSGVELMAEISEQFPDKKITIIDSNSHLCSKFPISTQNYLEEWVSKRPNITLKLNCRINEIITPYKYKNSINECNWCKHNECQSSNKTIVICNKEDIEQYKSHDEKQHYYQLKTEFESSIDNLDYDMVFKCAGFQPNSQLFEDNTKVNTNKRNFVCVDDWMRLVNNKNIFAIGDVSIQSKVKEIKMAHTAELHAQYIRDFMVNNEKEKELYMPYHEWVFGKKLKEKDAQYKMPFVFAVSLGRTDGSMGFDKILLNGAISALLKWFIEVSSMVAYQRKPIFDLKLKDKSVFKLYQIGNRIFTMLWKFNHFVTLSHIRR